MMKVTDITVPVGVSFFLDDIGWMLGRDDRVTDGPSRTGIPRRHVLADYVALNEIGKACKTKIGGAFCIGEWDVNNLLRKVPESSQYGEKWDCSKYLNVAEAEQMRDYLNDAEYIDIALHGLLHETWQNGKYVGGQEYLYPTEEKGKLALRSESFIRSHLDTFFELYDDWKFRQKITLFTSPGSCGTAWKDDVFAAILRDYGIRYWNNNCINESRVSNGILIQPTSGVLTQWNAYGVDPDCLPVLPLEKTGIIGGHWPNLLRFNPEHNLDDIDRWVRYYDRATALFGTMKAPDNAFAHRQQMYHYHSKTEQVGEAVVVDFSEADALFPKDLVSDAFISIRNVEIKPACVGATLVEHDRRDGFVIYRVERNGNPIIRIM